MVYPVREAVGVSAGDPLPRDFYLFAGESEHPTNRAPVQAAAVIPIFTFLVWNSAKDALIPWQPESASATSATGSVVVSALPEEGDYLVIGGVPLAFTTTTPAGAGQITIAASTTAMATDIATAFAGKVAGLTLTNTTAGTVSLSFTAGAAGNAIALGTNSAGLTLSGATLTGGADAVVATDLTPFGLLAVESPIGTQSLPYYEAGYFNELAINWPVSLASASLVDRQYALRDAERFTLGSLS